MSAANILPNKGIIGLDNSDLVSMGSDERTNLPTSRATQPD
jgi:hypothetical protein